MQRDLPRIKGGYSSILHDVLTYGRLSNIISPLKFSFQTEDVFHL